MKTVAQIIQCITKFGLPAAAGCNWLYSNAAPLIPASMRNLDLPVLWHRLLTLTPVGIKWGEFTRKKRIRITNASHTAHKLIYLAETHHAIRISKKGKVGKLGSDAKVNIGLMRKPEPTKIINHKAGTSNIHLMLAYQISEKKPASVPQPVNGNCAIKSNPRN